MIITIILNITFAYFLGSISNSILICKFFNLIDPRNYGSKNPGATNVFRIAGYKLAITVALLDSIKGAVPIWIGSYLKVPSIYLEIIGISVCTGHMYPIFFKFYGGKGVATAFGTISAINIDFSIIMIGTWILIILLFRYVSLGSIITAIIMPCYAWYINNYTYCFFMITLSFLILIRHIDNIKRLWNHQEKRIWDP